VTQARQASGSSVRALVLALVSLAACGHHDRPAPSPDPERQHRVIEPPSGRVRPLPPHAIRADGVGPYRLGAPLADLLDQLPSGPRIATLDIPGVVHRSMLRAEDDAILIGGEPLGRASFVAVVGGEVARTESGLHVGSTRADIGPLQDDPLRARDPRVVVPQAMPGARILLDGDRVAAIVITADDEAPRAGSSDCTRPAGSPDGKKLGACLSAGGEIIAIDGDDIAVRAPDGEKPIAAVRVSGLVFAAPLQSPVDGRDELVAIARTDDTAARTWSLVAFHLEGNHLVKTMEQTVYVLSATGARWIGAELKDLDLYLELISRPEAIEVGGLLTSRPGDADHPSALKLRDIVVISPTTVARRRAKSAPPEASDAGSVNDGHP